jgi:phenylacetate-coenzyme A ligase PaaK-like adenylate-forming protein
LLELASEPCERGRTLARAKGGALGRADDMLSVRGVTVYPSAIDALLHGTPSNVERVAACMRVMWERNIGRFSNEGA